MTQVTAGCETINFRKNCPQLWQSNSALQSGSDDAEQTPGLSGREAIGHETPENRDNE
jgi:hypothetical protein